MIKGEAECWPLMEVLERRVIASGGIPDICLVPPNNERGKVWSSNMARYGSAEQLAATPSWHEERYRSMTKYLEVLGACDPQSYSDLNAAQSAALAAADRPFSSLRLGKPWVLTLFPTQGLADLEGLSLQEYTQIIVEACSADPLPLKVAEEALAPLFEKGRVITIDTACPHEHRELSLRLDISPSRPCLCYGLRNFPDGEIYTSPDARSAQGEIYFDLPVSYGGVDIQGIYLRLEQGRIVEYSAVQGNDKLSAIIEADEGSHRLGEVALGMNGGLSRVLKHPLFVEKVGGTLHLAIGASYDRAFVEDPASPEGKARLQALVDQGIMNASAQHVDIVTDFRPGGAGRRVRIDETELEVRGGVWRVKGG
jgi:aminopeptidase